MARALDAGDARRATTLYAQAAGLLRGGDSLHAATLHALGARALDASGDTAGAAGARSAAGQARASLRAGMPQGMLARYDDATGATRQ
jgi:hypothetical protein